MRKKAAHIFLFSMALFLGSYRGYIALFEKDSQEPMQIFHYKVEALPPEDQILLNTRIRIRDRQELDQLLEDYLS